MELVRKYPTTEESCTTLAYGGIGGGGCGGGGGSQAETKSNSKTEATEAYTLRLKYE